MFAGVIITPTTDLLFWNTISNSYPPMEPTALETYASGVEQGQHSTRCKHYARVLWIFLFGPELRYETKLTQYQILQQNNLTVTNQLWDYKELLNVILNEKWPTTNDEYQSSLKRDLIMLHEVLAIDANLETMLNSLRIPIRPLMNTVDQQQLIIQAETQQFKKDAYSCYLATSSIQINNTNCVPNLDSLEFENHSDAPSWQRLCNQERPHKPRKWGLRTIKRCLSKN
jgi:hypothetical protein